MNVEKHIVFVVDDDRPLCEALSAFLTTFDMHVVTFASIAEYIAYPKPDVPTCLILDVELPDMNGLDFQSRTGGEYLPQVVFITGHADIPSSVRAIKAGAVDFLTKPIAEANLIRAIHTATARDRDARRNWAEMAKLRQRLSGLTPREQEVLPLVIGGFLNKQAAAQLGISEITFQIHRRRIMQKMEADSLAELVRMSIRLEVPIKKMRLRAPSIGQSVSLRPSVAIEARHG